MSVVTQTLYNFVFRIKKLYRMQLYCFKKLNNMLFGGSASRGSAEYWWKGIGLIIVGTN